jgi:glycosyltransferase involved in cell wall biosynthesis
MNWLFLAMAHHAHAQNIARALYQNQCLGKWYTGFTFLSQEHQAWWLPKFLKIASQRRVIDSIPSGMVRRYPWPEMLRVGLHRLKSAPAIEDLIWEKGEFAFDRKGARALRKQGFNGVIGFEHGCLSSIREAKNTGKKSSVIFASVHHSTRERWVDSEYAGKKEWADSSEGSLLKRAAKRDRRRDEEAQEADHIFTNSELVLKSLVDAGFPADKISGIPLGLCETLPEVKKYKPTDELRVLYVGTVALHKGFPYLQEAFQNLKTSQIRLDVHGAIRVNHDVLSRSDNVRYHGQVFKEDLIRAYEKSDVLVFPTLCDGFGQVVGEALQYGVPVICSEQAGASVFIKDGQNGFKVPAGDSGAIRERLLQCLEERDKLYSMRENARQTALSWTWSDFREKWFQAFKSTYLTHV